MKHTPGPWLCGWAGDPDADGKDEAGPLGIVALGRGGVAELVKHNGSTGHANTWEIVEANGALIAAAPRMAEILLSAWQHVSHGGPTRGEVEDVLREAGLIS